MMHRAFRTFVGHLREEGFSFMGMELPKDPFKGPRANFIHVIEPRIAHIDMYAVFIFIFSDGIIVCGFGDFANVNDVIIISECMFYDVWIVGMLMNIVA